MTKNFRKLIPSFTITYLPIYIIGLLFSFLEIPKMMFVVPLLWLLITGLGHLLVKGKPFVILMLIMDVIMSGLTFGIYYGNIHMTYPKILPAIATFLLCMALEYGLIALPSFKDKHLRNIALFSGLIAFFWFLRWMGGDRVVGSSMFVAFYVLSCIHFSFRHIATKDEHPSKIAVLRHSTMFVFFGLLFAVFSVLSDGELVDFTGDLFVAKKRK